MKDEKLLNELQKMLNEISKETEKLTVEDFNITIGKKGERQIRDIEGRATDLLFGLSDLVYVLYAKCNINKEDIKQCVEIGFDYKDKNIVED